jgi:hypothetical protein
MFGVLLLSATLLSTAEAPAAITNPKIDTEFAQAVYLADQAALQRGELSQIAVLGTSHLSSLPADFDKSRLAPLLSRLAAFAPDKILIEALSGAQCDFLREYQYAYPDTAEQYCYDPTIARQALKLSGAEAAEQIAKLLARETKDRPATERRRLSALFMAAGNPVSALVQWLRLAKTERISGDGLTAELVSQLEKRSLQLNENISIGAALAAQLGHEQVYPVDDHTGDAAIGQMDEKVFGPEIRQIWDNQWAIKRSALLDQQQQHFVQNPKADVLEWYRQMNTAEEARRAVAGDFGAAAGAQVAGNTGRKYLAYWETRNMRMVANIREAIGADSKVLAIVGSAHKAYYERYLSVSSDLSIVDIRSLLK